MATGFQLKSAWGFQAMKGFYNMPMIVQLRKEAHNPVYKHWVWQNFFWGTDYSGTTATKTFEDSPAGPRTQYHIGLG